MTNDQAEQILAEAIDDLYLVYKTGFVDYKNKTHKLGWFKEAVKQLFHERLLIYESSREKGKGQKTGIEVRKDDPPCRT